MKIALICHAQYPIAPPFAGGLESITHATCHRLARAGHDVHLFAHAGSDTAFPLTAVDVESLPTTLRAPSATIALATSRTEFEIHENLRYAQALADLRGSGFDLIQNHSLHPVPVLMGAATGLPMITTLHTPPIPYLEMSALAVRDAPSHRFVAVSEDLGRQWADYTGLPSVIRNGIDVDEWKWSADAPTPAAFWFGRICAEKAPHLAIEAARLGRFPLRLAGPIYDEEYFRAEIEPRLGDGVDFLGHLTQPDLNAQLLRASALLFTSVWEEPYGLTIAEALASGTPVVAFEVGAAPELIDLHSGILVPREDVPALAAGFTAAQCIDRANCRRRAEEFCGIGPMIQAYLDLYEQMTAAA